MFKFFQLIIGNFGLSYEQSKLQFALWAIMASVSIRHEAGKDWQCNIEKAPKYQTIFLIRKNEIIAGNISK